MTNFLQQWWIAILPGLSISLSSVISRLLFKYDLQQSAANVPFRPPGFVFGIVWPILFVTMGLTWGLARPSAEMIDTSFAILVADLCLWLPLYPNSRTLGAICLVSCYTLAVLIGIYLANIREYWALGLHIPIILWTGFASYLNLAEFVVDS